MSKPGIGIIGAGGIVETNHLPAICILPQVEVKWVYDKNPARMELLSRMYSIPVLSGKDVEKGLDEVDICLLATPYGVRKSYVEFCREKGKALVVEKPFAFSGAEHAANCAGFSEWQIAVNLQRRFYRSAATLRSIVEKNLFGRLREVRFSQGHFSLKGGSGYLSDVRLAGGGVIAESAIHSLDLILWISAAQSVAVREMHALYERGLDYDASFVSDLYCGENIIKAFCEISTLRNLENGLQLQFEQATVCCDLSPDCPIYIKGSGGEQLDFTLSPQPVPGPLSGGARKINEAFLLFWRLFLSGMESRTANMTSAGSSLLTSAWIGEIYKSMQGS
jgi:predicted dehydrogenase